MIDYETTIFNRVYADVAPLCAKKGFTSTVITNAQTVFPAASLIEMDNTTIASRQTNRLVENFARITYQLDVFAQSKSECKKVYAAADGAMIGLNFTRISGHYIDNPGNIHVFRYTARYEAEVDSDGNLYRRS